MFTGHVLFENNAYLEGGGEMFLKFRFKLVRTALIVQGDKEGARQFDAKLYFRVTEDVVGNKDDIIFDKVVTGRAFFMVFDGIIRRVGRRYGFTISLKKRIGLVVFGLRIRVVGVVGWVTVGQ